MNNGSKFKRKALDEFSISKEKKCYVKGNFMYREIFFRYFYLIFLIRKQTSLEKNIKYS